MVQLISQFAPLSLKMQSVFLGQVKFSDNFQLSILGTWIDFYPTVFAVIKGNDPPFELRYN